VSGCLFVKRGLVVITKKKKKKKMNQTKGRCCLGNRIKWGKSGRCIKRGERPVAWNGEFRKSHGERNHTYTKHTTGKPKTDRRQTRQGLNG